MYRDKELSTKECDSSYYISPRIMFKFFNLRMHYLCSEIINLIIRNVTPDVHVQVRG